MSGSERSLQRIAASLRAAGVPARVRHGLDVQNVWESSLGGLDLLGEEGGVGVGTHRLEVAPNDAAMAEQVVRVLTGRESESPQSVPERDGHCPACGARLGDGVAECPDCGLSLGAGPSAGAVGDEPPDLGLPVTDPLGFPRLRMPPEDEP